MSDKDKLIEILYSQFKQKVPPEQAGLYKKRLMKELKEISLQGEYEYFLNLYYKGIKYPKNENNILTPYLLGIVSDFDITNESAYNVGESPDIDSDFHPIVRDYIKNVWAPQTFGAENVCNIGNYATFGIKNALIDMVRVYGLDRNEILKITTQLPAKDEDAKDWTWDKAINSNPQLAKYCEDHPDVAAAAKRLVGRKRGKGKHAAGLIISNSRIDDLVPIITDNNGNPISAWAEGLHTQDLQPVGLVKFDLLVITNLQQIALCVKLIKERHGIEHICADESGENWSDTSYLNDPKALEIANKGLLRCIFQFDSPGIRDLVKRGGVDSFDDLVAYSSLFRPGPLNMAMDKAYIARKRGEEEYEIHPLLKPILGSTYNIFIYQEQVMKALNVVGNIPLTHCTKIIKAISKKKDAIFAQYKEMFIENGQKNLEWSKEQVVALWDQIAAFAEYGFNKSHAVSYTFVTLMSLYLKAHYPLEFFAATLNCEKDTDKIKEYRSEAERFGIKIMPIDINKSGAKFEIVDDTIYVGLSNIKGIGEEVAEEIVKNRPYTSFEDFLNKFGTDASVVKPLLGLRIFKEADPVVLYEFYEHYKDQMKKRTDRDKRHVESKKKYIERFLYLLCQCGHKAEEFTEEEIEDILQHPLDIVARFPGIDEKETRSIVSSYDRCVSGHQKKQSLDQPVIFSGYKPTGKISDKKLQEIYEGDIATAERLYLGFGWMHFIESSPDYKGGFSFTDYDKALEEEGMLRPVEGWIVEIPKPTKSQSGKTYYIMKLEDENERQEKIVIWPDEYERFERELTSWESEARKGNIVRLHLDPPKFKRYSFRSLDWKERRKPPSKKDDARLVVLEKPPLKANVVAKAQEILNLL